LSRIALGESKKIKASAKIRVMMRPAPLCPNLHAINVSPNAFIACSISMEVIAKEVAGEMTLCQYITVSTDS
jgi:hypothetical protein